MLASATAWIANAWRAPSTVARATPHPQPALVPVISLDRSLMASPSFADRIAQAWADAAAYARGEAYLIAGADRELYHILRRHGDRCATQAMLVRRLIADDWATSLTERPPACGWQEVPA